MLCAFEALFEKKLFRRIENSEAPAVEAIFGPASGLRPVVPVARSGAGRSVGPSDRFNHRPSARQEAVGKLGYQFGSGIVAARRSGGEIGRGAGRERVGRYV